MPRHHAFHLKHRPRYGGDTDAPALSGDVLMQVAEPLRERVSEFERMTTHRELDAAAMADSTATSVGVCRTAMIEWRRVQVSESQGVSRETEVATRR